MSRWFDILYRREDQAASAPGDPDQDVSPVIGAAPAGGEGFAPGRSGLRPAPPLHGLPGRWALEVQKIVFHLNRGGDEPSPRRIVFSGMQKQGGTTTICYLVAHHLATESNEQRVVYIDFNADPKRKPMPGATMSLQIGQALTGQLFSAITHTFTHVSISPADERQAATASAWLRQLMTLSRQHCDWVLVDAPPFFAAPEAYSVAKACDGVVLVLKSGETRYPALNALVADLELLGIKVLGTVLNFRQYPIPRWLLKYI